MIQNEYEKTDTMMMDEYDTRGKKVRGGGRTENVALFSGLVNYE